MADPDNEHADVAGWLLGALDPEQSEHFKTHLESCGQCQREVAELSPVTHMVKDVFRGVDLATGPGKPEPPADLHARTMTRIRQASWKSRRRRGDLRMLAVTTAAVAVVAAGGIGIAVAEAAPAVLAAYTTSLHHLAGTTGSAQAVTTQVASDWSVQMNVQHLKQLPSDEYYECVWARPGHPGGIPGGTFTVGASGRASVQMWTAANPDTFPTMKVVIEKVGDLTQQGTVVLVGTNED
jgi:hypothetical protein